jgi:hypothetical protein
LSTLSTSQKFRLLTEHVRFLSEQRIWSVSAPPQIGDIVVLPAEGILPLVLRTTPEGQRFHYVGYAAPAEHKPVELWKPPLSLALMRHIEAREEWWEGNLDKFDVC